MTRTRALFAGVALAALLVACRGAPERIPAPALGSTPEETPGAAERAQLGSEHMRPSEPPPGPDGGLLTPEGDAVSAAVNAERARLADAGTSAAPADAGGSDAKIGTPNIDAGGAEGAPDDGASEAERIEKGGGEVGTLVLSSSVAGELVPCGCSPDLRGGLPRAASLLARWRTADPALVYLDAGDLLFAEAAASEGPSATQQKLKAGVLARGEALLGAAARVVGARDLAAGGKFVAESADGVPLLDAGAEVPGARATLLVRAGPSGVPVGLFAAGLGAAPEKTIAARAAALRAQGAWFVVLLFHPQSAGGQGSLAAAQRILPAARAAGVDLVVLAHRDDPALDPNYAASSGLPLLALEGHGQSLLRLELIFPPGVQPGAPVWMPKSAAEKKSELVLIEGRAQLLRARRGSADAELKALLEKKIAELEARKEKLTAAREQAPAGSIVVRAQFRPLTQELPDDPSAKALVAAYDQEVADENLAAAKKLPAECPRAKNGEPSFIGVSASGVAGSSKSVKGESCASCHASEAAFWLRTRHARAYETLVAKGKQYSFDCISCHTTGWQQPGGVCRIDRTAAGGPGLPTPVDRTGAGFAEPLPATLAEGRQGVQCEACHGPASEHAQDGSELVEEVPASTCERCHDFANSPHFSFEKYRPWVVGPGHGEPLAKGELPRTRGELLAGNKLGPNPALHGVPQTERGGSHAPQGLLETK